MGSETDRTDQSSKEKTHSAAKVVERFVNIVEATYSPNSKKKSISARNPSTNLSCLDLLLMKLTQDSEKGFCYYEAAPNLSNSFRIDPDAWQRTRTCPRKNSFGMALAL